MIVLRCCCALAMLWHCAAASIGLEADMAQLMWASSTFVRPARWANRVLALNVGVVAFVSTFALPVVAAWLVNSVNTMLMSCCAFISVRVPANGMLVVRCGLLWAWVRTLWRPFLRESFGRGTPMLSKQSKLWLMVRYADVLCWLLTFLGCCQSNAEGCIPAVVVRLYLAVCVVVGSMPVPPKPPRIPRDRLYVTKHKGERWKRIICKRLGRHPCHRVCRGVTTVPEGYAHDKPSPPPSAGGGSGGGGHWAGCAGQRQEESAGASGGGRGGSGDGGGNDGGGDGGGGGGEFPGSMHDVWICSLCDARNVAVTKVCSRCGKLACWAQDLSGGRDGANGKKRRLHPQSRDQGDDRPFCDVAQESFSGALTPIPQSRSTARSLRSARRSASPTSAPVVPNTSPPAPKKARRLNKSACGKYVCGLREGGDDDHPACWACDGSPVVDSGNKQRWIHFQNDAAVEAAQTTWSEILASGADRGRVKDGRAPRMDCFCNRKDCMVALLKTWGKEPALTCAVCLKASADRWRTPGGFLHALRILFSRRDPQNPGRIPLGSTLEVGSNICNRCYMRGFTFSHKLKAGDRLSVREELELASSSQSPAPHSLSGAKHSTRLCFLNRLNLGEFVYLEDGVKVYEEARLDAKQQGISRKSLVKDVQTIMQDMGATLTDAEFVTFSAAETGSNDSRRKAQYVMPFRMSHLEHAVAHERALAAEAELAKYKEGGAKEPR